ncbi:unnamed protein product [Anisakis simplex]|uniref:Uncharacterized protein n=1 Tax=Anisakis simplex TaxID=6269 RepID=A0A0M3J569_ANISI|nr:unnamed protein product [Anisakis simplex]
MGKRRGNRTEPLIPKSLKANITSKMREEKDAEEIFENAFVSKDDNEISKNKSTVKNEAKIERQQRDISFTDLDDQHTFDTDVINTYSQSSGTISYDSRNSSRLDIADEDRVIRYDRKQEPLRGQLEKVFDEVQKPELRIVNDIQMTKMISGKFLNIQSKQIVPDENIYANYEIEQSKKVSFTSFS